MAPLRNAALMPRMPPRSLSSTRLVIRLLIAGCKMPPPIEAGTIASSSQPSPSQPLLASDGKAIGRL